MDWLVGFGVGVLTGALGTVVAARITANWWRLTGRPPADVVVGSDPAVYLSGSGLPDWVSFEVFVPGISIEDVEDDPPATGRHAYRWAAAKGGWPAQEHHLQVTIVAREDATILVEGLEAVIVNREDLPPGIDAVRAVGGAEGNVRHVLLSMVEVPPLVSWIDDDGNLTKRFKFDVTKGDPERFEIVADVRGLEGSLVEWRAVLHLIAEGRKFAVTVDDSGRPFRTASVPPGDRYVWVEDRWHRARGE